MSSATALTIIAIAVAVLAILALVAVIFLMRLVLHLIAFERTLTAELAELRQLASHLRETTERVGHTVHDVQVAARRVGGVVGTVASLLIAFGRPNAEERVGRLRPWLTGASIGLSLIRRRQQRKTKKQNTGKKKKNKKTKPPLPPSSSLTL